MAYNTKKLKTDLDLKPTPQYYNTTQDDYEVLEGQHGASFVKLKDSNGNIINPASSEDLAALKDEMQAVKNNQTSGDQKVVVAGNVDSLRGLLANRPAPNAQGITPGRTLYWAVDDGWVYASDGATWHKVVEVGAWI